MMNGLLKYLRAAPWPHATTLKMSLLAWLSFLRAEILLAQDALLRGMSYAVLSGLFLWGVCLCQADAFSRFREFQRVRGILADYGFKPRILRPVSSSRCQRDAALLAARETGHLEQARSYFKKLGYRWYHILPDRIVANPLYFFHPTFIRSTFIPGKRV